MDFTILHVVIATAAREAIRHSQGQFFLHYSLSRSEKDNMWFLTGRLNGLPFGRIFSDEDYYRQGLFNQ
jgi:hypothetical protein